MQTTSADTMQRWSSHEGLGPRLSTHFSAEVGQGHPNTQRAGHKIAALAGIAVVQLMMHAAWLLPYQRQ